MDLEKIQQLMAAMESRGITKMSLKEESGFHLVLERKPPISIPSSDCAPIWTPSHFESQVDRKIDEKEKKVRESVASQGYEVTSPMVGTFYSAPSPGLDPFVKIGDVVTEDSIIGVIEAMKVMNEIKAGRKGVVTEIFIENAHPVEFGTKLLRLA